MLLLKEEEEDGDDDEDDDDADDADDDEDDDDTKLGLKVWSISCTSAAYNICASTFVMELC